MSAIDRLEKSLKRGHVCPHSVPGNEGIYCDMCNAAEVLQFLDWIFNEPLQYETGLTIGGYFAQGFVKNDWIRVEANTKREALYLLFEKGKRT